MATELAKAYVQIVPSARGISGKIEEALGGEAEKGGKAGGERFSGAFAKAAKLTTVALAATTAAVGAIAKSAISAYADYEQLIGGVETLFSNLDGTVSAAPQVLENAANAYRTAGMSANQYMETVTSFSAALVSSLDGDYAKAASVSDMAIADMADNANKMGTSMEMIQNAYQGFAKQNYTMLDNLKLGYGGTTTEMERLLKEASAISGVDYGIDNLNDVYEAIHVIQTQMGITGTTAKEAASTISGSLAMTKAAWKNVLTGIADENADFGGLIDNLVESASAFAGNILPRIGQALQGVGQLVTGLAPVITEALPALVTDVLPGLLDSGAQMLGGIVTGLFDAIPDVYDAAVELVDELAADISENLPTLIPKATEAITTLATELTSPDSVETILGAATDIIEALALGILQSIPIVVESAPEIISNLALGIRNALPGIGKAAKEILNTMAESLLESLGEMVNVGENLVKGIWKGISGMGGWLRRKLNEWAEGLVGWVKDIFGIASPSKVFADIGGNLTAGLWKGWDKGFPRVMDAIDADLGGITANAFSLTGQASYTAALAPAGVGYAAPQNDGIVGMVTSIYGMLVEIRDTIPDRLGIDGREVSDVVDRYLGIKAVRKERGN